MSRSYDRPGRWDYWWKERKRLVTDLLNLDVRQVRRHLDPEQPCQGYITWGQGSKEEASIVFVNVPGQGLLLRYACAGEPIEEFVRWTTTVPTYGGRRYWWLCPACGRRCGILYGGPQFLCRDCHCLTYVTAQSKRVSDSIDNRLCRIRKRLGASCGIGWWVEPLPDKPKWMHWETYHRLFFEYHRLLRLRTTAILLEFPRIAGPVSGGTLTIGADLGEQRHQVRREAGRHLSLWENLAELPLPKPDSPVEEPVRPPELLEAVRFLAAVRKLLAAGRVELIPREVPQKAGRVPAGDETPGSGLHGVTAPDGGAAAGAAPLRGMSRIPRTGAVSGIAGQAKPSGDGRPGRGRTTRRGKGAGTIPKRVLGWECPDGSIYLLPDLARRAVERTLGPGGLNGIGNRTLYKQLSELGMIASHNPGRCTRKVREGRRLYNVLHLLPDALDGA